MMSEQSINAPMTPLNLEGLDHWLVERGVRGLPLDEQFEGFCQRIFDAGFPMKRAQMAMGTLHPRYGAQTFVWRADTSAVEHTPRERTPLSREGFLQSPVHYLRSNGLVDMRLRLGTDEPDRFPIIAELRAEGMTEYAARIVPYDLAKMASTAFADDLQMERGLDGVFFSCATDRPEGFDDAALDMVTDSLTFLTLGVKARATYDVAKTVIETYLGRDAGHRVLTGAIERGSVESIRAVIWFSDLRGFTRLTDTIPRDELIEMLNDYLEAMARPIQENQGQILKFMGDGLLATFNLTGRNAGAVCREALAAAADLQAAFPAFNQQREKSGKPVMDFGLALHVGEVFYGNIGASERLDFTVVGPAVNEASRIQSLCRSLERNVLISSAVQDAVGDQSGKLLSLGFHALRGVREPQELFTLGG
jgi:adenylate cyclase